MTVHIINLAGPWQLRHAQEDAGVRVRLPILIDAPAAATGDADRAAIFVSRHFHRPTGLHDKDQVGLRLAGLAGAPRIKLNGVELVGSDRMPWERELQRPAGPAALCCDVTHLLELRNRLELEFQSPAGEPCPVWGLAGPVMLEINSSSELEAI